MRTQITAISKEKGKGENMTRTSQSLKRKRKNTVSKFTLTPSPTSKKRANLQKTTTAKVQPRQSELSKYSWLFKPWNSHFEILPQKKKNSLRQIVSLGRKILPSWVKPNLTRLLYIRKEEQTLPNSFYVAYVILIPKPNMGFGRG